jgi:protease I
MELSGYRIAILAENHYEDMELWYPYYRFQEAGADVFVVGSGSADHYTSKHGYPVRPDADADTVRADQFDAVIIPGGWAPDYMRRAPAMIDLVRDAAHQGKLVAAICHGGWMLASAGVIRGRTVTGFRSIRDDLVNAGAEYADEEVVRDGNLVTSRQPSDLPAFCREAISALQQIGRTAKVAHRRVFA